MNASGITLLSCLSAIVLAASAVQAQQAPASDRWWMLNHLVVDKAAPRVRLAAPAGRP